MIRSFVDYSHQEERYLTKFGDEIILHSQQRHPNIVKLLGVHYPTGSQLPTLVMEYLPYSLSQLLERKVPLKADSILLDVANGLNYLHQKRPPIIHRDLSANNVLLTTEHKAKISDLGMSKLDDAMKKHLTTAPGNPYMMPPEALEHNPVYDNSLDVFSFGCLILHVLSGQIPVPTKEFAPKPSDPGSFVKVSEWDRRASYIKQVPPNNDGLLYLAKQCLGDNPSTRPSIAKIIEKLKLPNQGCRPSFIFFKACDGKTHTILFMFDSEDTESLGKITIAELKAEVSKRTHIPECQMRLICSGKQLEDDRTFRDYNIQPSATIHLVLRLCGK